MFELIDWMEIVVITICCCAASQHYVHMLQLESYQIPGYRGYLARTRERLLRRELAPGFIIAFLSWIAGFIGKIASRYGVFLDWTILGVFVLYTAGAVFRDLRLPAKKPLVFTKRIIRLYAVIAVMYFAVTLLIHVITLPPYLAYAAQAFMVALAAMAVDPLEKRVNAGFFESARAKIEDRGDLIRIGITGSYGKTSTKFALAEILSVKYRVLATPASFNTPMGVSRVINEQLSPEHQVFIAEMGARHEGDITELCELVHPKYGLITSIGPQHLETFGTLEKIADTKYEIVEGLPEDGVAFFSSGSIMLDRLYVRCDREKYRATTDPDRKAFVRAKDIASGHSGSTFTLECEDGTSAACKTNLLGLHNIQNIALCAAVARKLGLTMDEIARGVRKLQPVEHRLQLIRGAITVIDDSFNSNPSGSAEALDVLAGFPGRHIIITPGMVEQGDKEEEINYAFGTQMMGKVDVAILVGPRHTLPIQKGLAASGFPRSDIYVVNNLAEATQLIGELHQGNDTVLFENDLPDNYNE